MTYRYKAPEITDARMHAIEHYFIKLGSKGFAKLMAAHLRRKITIGDAIDLLEMKGYKIVPPEQQRQPIVQTNGGVPRPMPHPEILESVARLLDPRPDDDLALILVRRSKGNPKMRWTKRAKDIKIALEVEQFLIAHLTAGKPMRGSIKLAAREIAKKRGINASTVEQTHRKIRRMIPK
jgi:hypothetical protein